MGKLDINKKQKKDALLSTAFELFTSKGIQKTSIADIVQKAGVAKGTFYLYFTDKYDVRNHLISHKASQLFFAANQALLESTITDFEDKIIFLVDHIINQLNDNKSLLTFISKNLSWGIFKSALISPTNQNDLNFYDIYVELLDKSPRPLKDPEIMIFMIVELVSSTCYSSILYKEPVAIEQLKPHIYQTIRHMIKEHYV